MLLELSNRKTNNEVNLNGATIILISDSLKGENTESLYITDLPSLRSEIDRRRLKDINGIGDVIPAVQELFRKGETYIKLVILPSNISQLYLI